MDRISASSLDELLQSLNKVPDDVPARGMGRRTEHTEPWVMKRLIACLATAKLLRFPLTVEMTDRPDIVIDSAGGGKGFEVGGFSERTDAAFQFAIAIRKVLLYSAAGASLFVSQRARRLAAHRQLNYDEHQQGEDGNQADDAGQRSIS